MALTEAQRTFNEGCSGLHTFNLLDESEDAIALDDLYSLTLTLYDTASNAIINNRNEQNVLNTNDVTVSEAGAVSWSIKPADTMIVNTDLEPNQTECHIAVFEWTWASGAEAGRYQ